MNNLRSRYFLGFAVGSLALGGLVLGAAGCSSDTTEPAGAGGSAGANSGQDPDGGSGGDGGSSADPDGGSGGSAGSSSDPDSGAGGAAPSTDPDGGSGGNPASAACDSPSCLQADGLHNGVAFDFGCSGGEIGFSPSSTENVVVPEMVTYDGVCGDGVNSDGFGTTYNVHLAITANVVDDLVPGTYDFDPEAVMLQPDGVGLVLQVTKSPAVQMSETSPNFVAASVTITAHEPRTMIEGTFTGSWGDDFTSPADPHAAYVHSQLCFAWEGTDCDVPSAEAVPADCTCTDYGEFVTGEVSGTFKWEF